MDVGDFEAGDHHADACRGEQFALSAPDALCYDHQMRSDLGREVNPVVDLVARDHKNMASGQGANVEECDTNVVLDHEAARDLAVDDAGEDGWHVGIVGSRP